MKYLLLLLALAGCASKEITSRGLEEEALAACKNEPELDMKRMYCAYSYVLTKCQMEDPDIRVCGELRRK